MKPLLPCSRRRPFATWRALGASLVVALSVAHVAGCGVRQAPASNSAGGSLGAAELTAALPRAIGLRASRYGVEPFPEPAYWVGSLDTYQRAAAVPAREVLWIVGPLHERGCRLQFPAPGPAPADVAFTDTDLDAAYLDAFDAAGVRVWLQVEPGFADVDALIDLVLEHHGHHPSVVGFGIDVEWYRSVASAGGEDVSDELARGWVERVRSHNPEYLLFVKHWLKEKLPPSERDGLVFIDDSQELPNADALVSEFAEWGEHFAPAPVGFQVGYPSDAVWWRSMEDAPSDLADALFERIPNARGVYWVDFSVEERFPRP